MTFTEMVTLLQSLGYGSGDATVQGLWINAAYRRICNKRAWSWLRSSAIATVVPGQIEYTWTNFGIASNPPRRLESARLVDTAVNPAEVWPLTWLEPQDFNDMRGHSAATWPASDRTLSRSWSRPDRTGLALWAPPDRAYVFHLSYIAPAAVLATTDEPAMPRDYHDAIVLEAAHWAASRQRDQVAISEFRSERDLLLAELLAEENTAQLHDYERIGGQDIWASLERRY